MAFFHPDKWSFGQTITPSQIIGLLESIPGVDYVIDVDIKRWNDPIHVVDNQIQLYHLMKLSKYKMITVVWKQVS